MVVPNALDVNCREFGNGFFSQSLGSGRDFSFSQHILLTRKRRYEENEVEEILPYMISLWKFDQLMIFYEKRVVDGVIQ